MLSEFKNLSNDEANLMLSVPALVTILIAGADDDIDKDELNEAITITKLKRFRARQVLINYYRTVAINFENQLNDFMIRYPDHADQRNPIIIKELERLNTILSRLDREFAIQFYASIRDFAKKIAETSGGFLGYMTIGYEEGKLMGLNMIRNPA